MDKDECQNKSVFQKKKEGIYQEFGHPRTGALGMRQLLHWPHSGHITQQLSGRWVASTNRHTRQQLWESRFVCFQSQDQIPQPCKREVKKCYRENLVNVLAFCLDLEEKAINPSSSSFSILSQKSGILVQKSHSANTAAYTPVAVLLYPKCKQAHIRHTLELPCPASSALLQRGMGRYRTLLGSVQKGNEGAQ